MAAVDWTPEVTQEFAEYVKNRREPETEEAREAERADFKSKKINWGQFLVYEFGKKKIHAFTLENHKKVVAAAGGVKKALTEQIKLGLLSSVYIALIVNKLCEVLAVPEDLRRKIQVNNSTLLVDGRDMYEIINTVDQNQDRRKTRIEIPVVGAIEKEIADQLTAGVIDFVHKLLMFMRSEETEPYLFY